jgi:hypothetical protein
MALHIVCSSALSLPGLSWSWELRVGRHDYGASVSGFTVVDVSMNGLCPILYSGQASISPVVVDYFSMWNKGH